MIVGVDLTRGDEGYTLLEVSVNDAVMVFAFALIVAFLLGVTDTVVPWRTLILSVVLFAGVLVQMPGMLTLVAFANRTRARFTSDEKNRLAAGSGRQHIRWGRAF